MPPAAGRADAREPARIVHAAREGGVRGVVQDVGRLSVVIPAPALGRISADDGIFREPGQGCRGI